MNTKTKLLKYVFTFTSLLFSSAMFIACSNEDDSIDDSIDKSLPDTGVIPYEINLSIPLTFEAIFNYTEVEFNAANSSIVVQYRKNDGDWEDYTYPILLNKGDTVSFRGNNASYAPCDDNVSLNPLPENHSHFSIHEEDNDDPISCYIYGNIMSLITSTDFESATELTAQNTFDMMFDGCKIMNHPQKLLLLPATTLKKNCYYQMFFECQELTKAPALPAMTMEPNCYNSMFAGCSKLAQAPALPATKLAYNCYSAMFERCDSLSSAPELPATSLAVNCYTAMFLYCSSLTEAPVLPAQTLAESCYLCMFEGCSKLSKVTCLATDLSAEDCTYEWLIGVPSSGSFIKAPEMADWTTGVHGIPDGWTVSDAE